MATERTARVERLVEHAADTRSLFLTLPPGAPLRFRPGQFISCLVPGTDGELNRPYSIASGADDSAHVELLLDRVPGGPGSNHLFGLGPGDTIRFTGPWGTFVLDDPPNVEVGFIAVGTGVAPIRSMLLRAAGRARLPLRLLYATRLGIYAHELAALGVEVTIVEPSRLHAETTARYVEADADRSRHLFVCGVGGIVHELRDLLRGAGYARRAVQYEKW